MNWSTRLRRWVRIRTPPVREASMKPTAATVLPAPVACSNQKRRSAPGSSGRLGDRLLAPPRPPAPPSPGAPRRAASSSSSSASSSSSPSAPRPRPSAATAVGAARRGLVAAVAAAAVLGGDLLLGHQLGQRPGERVDLVGVELGAVAQLRRLVGEQPLEPEQQREVAAPLDRGVLGPCVELGQRGVERPAARRPRGQRLGPLAVEQERLAGERRRPLDVGA